MRIYMIGQKGIPAIGGGVENHVEELSKKLVTRGHEVFVYCRKGYTLRRCSEPRAKDSPSQYEGVNLIYLPTIYSKHLEAIVHTFLASIDVLKRDADIIHYHAIGPSSLLWIPKLLKRSAKVVSTYHCQDYKHQKWGLFARAYLHFGEYIACKFSDTVVTVSKGLRNFVKSHYHKVAWYVPNGVSKMENTGSSDLIKQWGLENGNYLVTISRLIKHKGIHYLIDAFNKLDTDKKLVIVGDSSYTDDYKKLLLEKANNNPNIIFTGSQSGATLAELLHNSYCFVQSSEAEGLSIALLEAMRAGKCSVVSDIPENMEVVETSGIVFENKNVYDLAKKLEYAINNPDIVKDLGKKSFQLAKEGYSWDNIVRQIELIYSRTVTGW